MSTRFFRLWEIQPQAVPTAQTVLPTISVPVFPILIAQISAKPPLEAALILAGIHIHRPLQAIGHTALTMNSNISFQDLPMNMQKQENQIVQGHRIAQETAQQQPNGGETVLDKWESTDKLSGITMAVPMLLAIIGQLMHPS